MLDLRLDERAMRRSRLFVVAVGYFAIVTAVLVFFGGWVGHSGLLKSIAPTFASMKPNTSVAIALLGTALVLKQTRSGGGAAAIAAASGALIIGVVTLMEYLFDWSAGIDQILFSDKTAPFVPERPAAATGTMITLLGMALLCVSRPALQRIRIIAAVGTALIAWATLNGYVFGPEALREVPAFGAVALHSAAILLLLGVAVLATRPISWQVGIVFGSGIGGVICRWLLPPALLAPPVLGWLLSREGALDVLPAQFDFAVYSAISTAGSIGLIMLLVRRLTVIDAERSAATLLSRRDPLTGIPNRRAFDSFLLEAFNLSKRHGHALSLMLLDIDRFKSYNDAFGHPAGDELLRTIAALLTSIARDTDLVARVGGEEFAVVLPETDAAGALRLAERTRYEVEQSSGFQRPVTVSIGIAALSAYMADPKVLVQECDLALYRAKSSGRNCVSSN